MHQPCRRRSPLNPGVARPKRTTQNTGVMQADPTGQPTNDPSETDRPGADSLSPTPATVRAERRWHWIVLAGACLFVAAGAIVDVAPEGAIGVASAPAITLPVVCPSRRLFGVECPGCGMTRSVTHLLHGRLSASLITHRLGWLVFAAIVFQIPYRTWRLTGRMSRLDGPRVAECLLWGFFVLLVVNWLLPR
jgi:Protein of unknown function (DUF2752)